MITYGSACSGIESASLAWEALGWKAEWFAEIEPFPSAVLSERWPHVPNLGDLSEEIAPTLRACGSNNGNQNSGHWLAVHENQRSELRLNEVHGALNTQGGKPGQGYPAVLGFNPVQEGMGLSDVATPVGASQGGGNQGAVLTDRVRRLTPVECERLQGMPDNHTLISWRGKPAEQCPDGPRYKAIGNSKAVPVVRWIGEQIQKQVIQEQEDVA